MRAVSDIIHKIRTFKFYAKDMELKAIKQYESMSEETYCYEANVYILGVKVGRVSNRGHGGCDDWDGDHDKGFNHSWLAELDIWCHKSLPKWYSKWSDSWNQKSFEIWCHEQVEKHIDEREFNKAMKKTLFIDPSEPKQISYFKSKPTKENLEILKRRNPDYIFLHDMIKAQAFKTFMENTG